MSQAAALAGFRGFARRPDLVVVAQHYGADRRWIVKDPLSLRFMQMREAEFAMFAALDGTRDIEDLARIFAERFAPQRVRADEIRRFVAQLHRAGLVTSPHEGQGEVLRVRGLKRRRGERLARLSNPLSIRFRGCDPTRLFDVVEPLARPLLSRRAVVAGCLFIAAAALLICIQWSTFVRRLPTFHEFFTPSNLLLLGCATAATKVLHELGHGLTCRRFGGECRELGVMILFFTPCLYCDVSDAWRIPDKRRRAAVGAAGIYVELLIAAAAAYLWWFSTPGVFNRFCFSLIVVCSVNTLLLNGNPLMRYDGYYILCDLLDAPNLARRSSETLRAILAKLLLGVDSDPSPFVPEHRRGWYAAYAAASGVYRWIVTFSIVVLLVEMTRPYRLEFVARLLGALILAGMVAGLARQVARLFSIAGSARRIKRLRAVSAGLLACALIGVITLVPLPHRIFGPSEIQTDGGTKLYAESSAALAELPRRYGDEVAAGEVVARLVDRELPVEIEELTANRDARAARLASLRREQFDDRSAALSIPQTAESLATLEQQLEEKRDKLAALTIRATRSGTLYPPSVAPASRQPEELPTWAGRPLDAVNIGARVEVGTLLAEIGENRLRHAVVVLEQHDVDQVRIGDVVEIKLAALRDETFHGRVDEIALGRLEASPARLSSRVGGELPTATGDDGRERPLATSYAVRVRLEEDDARLRLGWRGTARIHVAPTPLAMRIGSWLSRTFQFKL